MHILNDEVDKIQKHLSSILSEKELPAAVKYVLTGSYAKLEIRLPGIPNETSEKIGKIHEAIASSFRPKS